MKTFSGKVVLQSITISQNNLASSILKGNVLLIKQLKTVVLITDRNIQYENVNKSSVMLFIKRQSMFIKTPPPAL